MHIFQPKEHSMSILFRKNKTIVATTISLALAPSVLAHPGQWGNVR
jgi:hypothetical protein